MNCMTIAEKRFQTSCLTGLFMNGFVVANLEGPFHVAINSRYLDALHKDLTKEGRTFCSSFTWRWNRTMVEPICLWNLRTLLVNMHRNGLTERQGIMLHKNCHGHPVSCAFAFGAGPPGATKEEEVASCGLFDPFPQLLTACLAGLELRHVYTGEPLCPLANEELQTQFCGKRNEHFGDRVSLDWGED